MDGLSVEYVVANEGAPHGPPYTNPSLKTWRGKQKRYEPGSTPGPRIFLTNKIF